MALSSPFAKPPPSILNDAPKVLIPMRKRNKKKNTVIKLMNIFNSSGFSLIFFATLLVIIFPF